MKINPYLPAVFLSLSTLAGSLLAGESIHIVTNLDDGAPGSLRAELATASDGDTISFAVRGTLLLTGGELLVSNNVTFAGPGATNLAISGAGQSRVMEVLPRVHIGLFGLTICDGHAADGIAGTSNNPAGGNGSNGGGIYNAGFVTIAQCVISNCAAGNGGYGYASVPFVTPEATNWTGGFGGCGGAIFNLGRLSLDGCTLTSDSCGVGGNGGGADQYGAAGRPGGSGGAIYNAGTMTLRHCAFAHNSAGSGGAGYSLIWGVSDLAEPGGGGGSGGAVCDAGQGPTSVSDCQFSYNVSGMGATGTTVMLPGGAPALGGDGGSGGSGGAIWAQSPLRMNGCTFLSNQTGPGARGGSGHQSAGAGGPGGPGGAICVLGGLSLTRCFCSSNFTGLGGDGGASNSGMAGSAGSGGAGGALYATGTLQLNDCAFTGNLAGSGGRGGNNPAPSGYPFGPGDGGPGGSGGAVGCLSDLAATNCLFNSNQAGTAGEPGVGGFTASFSGQSSSSGADGGQGGGIVSLGPVMLYGCTIRGNLGGRGTSADPSVGALANAKPGSTETGGGSPRPNFIYYERQGGPGGSGGSGGVYSENTLSMVLCTLAGNRGGAGGSGGASWGGFMFEDGPKGGAGGSGGSGGAYSSGSNGVVLVACTIADNTGGLAGPGGSGEPRYDGESGNGSGGQGGAGGIDADGAVSAAAINTILASNVGGIGGGGAPFGNPGAADLQGSFSSLGYNLIGQVEGSSGFTNGVNGDLVGSASAPLDPFLGPLADNGGTTPTMALLHGSPCLDAGDDALLESPYSLTQDQRGFPRKSGPHVDIGAFEFQYTANAALPPTHAPNLSGTFSYNDNLQPNTPSAGSAVPVAMPGFQLMFRNERSGATFSVLATSDLSVPSNQWLVIGQAVQTSPGLFQFTDSQATNTPQRFYRVSSP